MYVIRPSGPASLYKLWVDGAILLDGDMIDVDENYVHYRNALIYKEKGSGPIVREHRWRVDLQCNFRRQRKVGIDYLVSEVYNYEMNLKSDYEADIHLFNDSTLKTELTGSQVRARLGDDLYVRVDLKGEWNVTMHLQDCVARPTPDSSVAYTLIQNGCASDSETFIVYTSHNTTLFHFKAFEFYSGFSTVYVFCDVIYCAPMDTNPKCTHKC
nr:hypothetical protein BaRGS_008781 [Batillaria attramentaria]